MLNAIKHLAFQKSRPTVEGVCQPWDPRQGHRDPTRSLLLGMRLREEGQKLLLIGHADQKTRKVGPTFLAEYRFLTTPTLPQNLQSLQKTMSFEVVDVTPKGIF